MRRAAHDWATNEPEVLDFIWSDIGDKPDSDVVTIRRERRGLQQRCGVRIRFAIVDIDPAGEKSVG